jgi:signal transduction histidine kinase
MQTDQDSAKRDDLQDWVAWLRQQRQRAVDFLLRVILILGFAAVVYTLGLAVRAGRFHFTTVYYLITYLIVLSLYFARRLGDEVRAMGIFLVIYGFAVLSLYSGWLAGSGRIYLMILIPVSGVLISPRTGFAAAGLSLLTYAAFGIAFNQKWLSLGPLPDPTEASPVFIEGVGFALSIALVSASQWFLAQALNAANQARIQTEEAREQAVQSEQVMVQFLSNVSHELRTPLNAIINFSQFVSSGIYGPINEKQVDTLNKSTDSARHLLAMINDILDMSKIEAGRMDLFVEEEVDLYPELEAAAAATAALLAKKPVEFIQEIEAELPAVVGDRRRIRQILLNLTSNAAKFTDQGQVWLRARREGDQVLFEVKDTGPGIASEDQARIFRPFHQSKRGAISAAGTGLGLPIAQHLAEAHGGKLWLQSTVGKGSTLHFSLPIRSASLTPSLEADDMREAVSPK